jgi:hypothetical protein
VVKGRKIKGLVPAGNNVLIDNVWSSASCRVPEGFLLHLNASRPSVSPIRGKNERGRVEGVFPTELTSIPARRDAPRDETKDRYIEFKRLEIC